jgi:hypothetical protein
MKPEQEQEKKSINHSLHNHIVGLNLNPLL